MRQKLKKGKTKKGIGPAGGATLCNSPMTTTTNHGPRNEGSITDGD